MGKTVVESLEDLLSDSGSLWAPEREFREYCKKKCVSLRDLNKIIDNHRITKYVTPDGSVYYTTSDISKIENQAAAHVNRILNEYDRPQIPVEEIDRILAKAREETGITLHEQQREAVIAGVNNGFVVITGGPGTGKTCTLVTLCYCLRRIFFGVDIRFTAPTGKAARRITESTGQPAKTVQKELAITPENKKKKFFRGGILIVDEVSMLDMVTANMVFESIHNGQKIILVGDINQLPSVGPGAVLRDLLWANDRHPSVVPFVQLTKTFRQANDSNLFQNICRIRNEGNWKLKEADDFQVVKVNDDPTQQLLDLVKQEIDKYGIDNVACLLPYRKKGLLCSNRINGLIQSMINPISIGTPHITVVKTEDEISREVTFVVGDPVMQLVNRRECANGDVGKVISIKNHCLIVQYLDTTVRYTKKDIAEELDLAYSMSINKSQGSEYASVVMGITMDHKAMLKRNLVYTGITRAKKRCVLLQDDEAMKIAISTEDEYNRTTFFAEKVQYLRLKNKYRIA